MSAARAAILEGMPEPRDLRMHEADGWCVVTAGQVVLAEYGAGDLLMRNMVLVTLRRLKFSGQAVARALGVICQDHGTRALPRPRDHLAAAVSSWCVRRGPSS